MTSAIATDYVNLPPWLDSIQNWQRRQSETTEEITANQSLRTAIIKSAVMGLPAPGLDIRVFGTGRFSLAAALLSWGAASSQAYHYAFYDRNVEVGHHAVATCLGTAINKKYLPGAHRLLKGFDDGIDVSEKDLEIDPPAFEQLAPDKVAVYVDVYAVIRIANGYLFLTAAGEPFKLLSNLLDTQNRLFVSHWLHGDDLINQKDLLGEFLCLPAYQRGRVHPVHQAFKNKLLLLTRGSGRGVQRSLSPEGVNAIMENAGAFCFGAANWGFSVRQIHARYVDIPPQIKAAAAELSAETARMKLVYLKSKYMVTMTKALKRAFPDLKEHDALTAVQILLGQSVKKDITEISLRDLDEISTTLGPHIADWLTKAGQRFANQSQTGGTT